MTENENMVSNDVQPPESRMDKFAAAFKEWGRKKIVGLKRHPQNVALFFLLVASVYFLMIMFPVSQAGNAANNDERTFAIGICFFIATLLSILVLVSFLNAFPKRKKPSIPFIILVYVMIAGIIACDLVYYLQMDACLQNITSTGEMYATVSAAQPYIIAHIVLLGIAAVVFALLPVYKRLINMIDTSIVVESATENMQKGSIDIQE